MIILFCLITSAWAQNDSAVEDRWNQIYQQYYSQAMTDEEWSQIAGEKLNETYTIQKGDTLWDISITLFGSGYYWPKVWQLNSSLTNPHSIEPGFELRFIPGSTDTPPTMEVSGPPGQNLAQKNTNNGPAPKDTKLVQNEYSYTPVIPPPTKVSRPVLMELPPSLPYLIARSKDNNFDESGFSMDEGEAKPISNLSPLRNFISETVPEKEGEILESEGNQTVASLYQHVYVQVEQGQIGQRYVSFNVSNKVSDVTSWIGDAGYSIDYEGEMELTELVNAEKNLFKALVKKQINPVRVGSFVRQGQIEMVDLSFGNNFSKVAGTVIGGEFDRQRKLVGPGAYIFFNVGEEDGVEVGQMMRILKNENTRKRKSLVREEENVVGFAKIVHVTKKLATGVILRAKDDIRPGDFAGDNVFGKLSESEVESELKTEALNLKEDQANKSMDQEDEPEAAEEELSEEEDLESSEEIDGVDADADMGTEEDPSADEDSDLEE